MNMQWTQLPEDAILQATAEKLTANGINAVIVNTGEEAKQKVLQMIPHGSEVMTMTSITLETIGLMKELDTSGIYASVRNKLNAMDRATQSPQMQKLGAAPEYAVGSAHAVTQDGQVMIASNTGSQLAAYVYGSPHVIWVVGGQKVVKDIQEGKKRLYEYTLPLESKRARKAYGLPDTWNSFVSKLLIINREVNKDRIHLILVKENLGF